MKNIIYREIRDRRYTLIAYCGIVVLLLVLYIALFPSIQDSLNQFQKIYETYPEGLYKAMGIENLSINSLENYLSIEMYNLMWQILALLLTSSLAGYAIAGQIEKGTIGFYLSLPIGRTKLFFSKYLAGLSSIMLFVVVSVGGSIPIAALFNMSMSKVGVAKLGILSLLFAWAIYSVALLWSAIFSERSRVYMVMGALLIGMYAMNVISSLKSSLAWLDNYSIFYYYNSQKILSGGNIRLSSAIVYSSIIVLTTILSLYIFKKRDISV